MSEIVTLLEASLTSCLCLWLAAWSQGDVTEAAQLRRDSSLGVSWALWNHFACVCGWDPADGPWLTQSCTGVCWKRRGACVGDVRTGPSWSGRKISPACGFAAYLQEPGERRPHLAAKCSAGGNFAIASKSRCRFFILHFLFPWVLWLIRNVPDSLPCLFTPVLQPVSRLLITDAGPGSLSWGC